MSKHYLATDSRIGPDKVADTVPVYCSLDGEDFSLSPGDIAGPASLLELRVRMDGNERYVEPPISDEAIDSALASILA